MKILAIDDEPTARLLLESSLRKWGYEPIVAETCEEALSIYSKGGINFVICDWIMPGELQGIDFVNLVRSADSPDNLEYTYIILLTSRNEQKDVYDGIKAGADDYICKPFDPRELKTRIQLGRRILTLRETNKILTKQLEEARNAQSLDLCTGVLNRQAFIKRLDLELVICRQRKKPLSLLVLVIDKVKILTYTYGYKAAEIVTSEVVNHLKSIFSPNDIIGRLGDADFAVIAPNCDEKSIIALSNMIKGSIEQTTTELDNKVNHTITTSIGTVTSLPQMDHTALKLLSSAHYPILLRGQKMEPDKLLYQGSYLSSLM